MVLRNAGQYSLTGTVEIVLLTFVFSGVIK